MKTISISLLFLCIALGTKAQNTSLSGSIIAPTGDSVFLYYDYQKGEDYVSDKLGAVKLSKNGSFEMKFNLDTAKSLRFFDGQEVTFIFMVPGDELKLTLHTSYFDETLSFSGKGAERNNTLAGFVLADELDWQPIYANMKNGDTAKLFADIDTITNRMVATITDYTKVYPEMADLLNQRKEGKLKQAEQQKKRIREAMEFKVLVVDMVGKPLVDIVGTGLNGEKVSLAQFRGKTTVIDFWATWCGPCKAEIPHWTKLEQQYGNQVNFVSVSVWDNLETWKVMAKELKQTHPMFIDKEGIKQLKPYMIKSIPRYMVIDKDLKIVTIDAPRPSSNELQKLF
ncbi:MAG: TlpA family protein disulfide reductase [Chitinophagales bacterium]|nr:TlpA family protein disulfide reductase [Chitinophagales bacterium]